MKLTALIMILLLFPMSSWFGSIDRNGIRGHCFDAQRVVVALDAQVFDSGKLRNVYDWAKSR